LLTEPLKGRDDLHLSDVALPAILAAGNVASHKRDSFGRAWSGDGEMSVHGLAELHDSRSDDMHKSLLFALPHATTAMVSREGYCTSPAHRLTGQKNLMLHCSVALDVDLRTPYRGLVRSSLSDFFNGEVVLMSFEKCLLVFSLVVGVSTLAANIVQIAAAIASYLWQWSAKPLDSFAPVCSHNVLVTVPLYIARIEDLGPHDRVKRVKCRACGYRGKAHVTIKWAKKAA
jgi:hypothetical protein